MRKTLLNAKELFERTDSSPVDQQAAAAGVCGPVFDAENRVRHVPGQSTQLPDSRRGFLTDFGRRGRGGEAVS
jgi:hypothetical protein